MYYVLKKVSSYEPCLSRREKRALAFCFCFNLSSCCWKASAVACIFFFERHECECIVGWNACKCFRLSSKVNIWTTLINPSWRASGVNTVVKTLLQSIYCQTSFPVCKAAFWSSADLNPIDICQIACRPTFNYFEFRGVAAEGIIPGESEAMLQYHTDKSFPIKACRF